MAGRALLDLATARANTARHARKRGAERDYADRSGWPEGEGRIPLGTAASEKEKKVPPSVIGT